ncbi:hypothetical protein C8R46DRAFT_1054828 [Mycena filopes]|nr:hypothetical protein C8R46DRAFT_1054828 [Mycena filopes]
MARPSYLESQGLSPSRIRRLLRPLRTKCIALTVAHPAMYAKQAAVYGSSRTFSAESPLDVLSPPPDGVHTDHRSVATLQTSCYAVREIFRDIVLKTQPAEPPARQSRVPRLADLCSTTVGENMEGEETSTGVDSEEDQLAEMEDLYEFIPVQYRRAALLAHSLDLALRCPHHCTLLSILLDVCLQYNLEHESRRILESLLQVAVSPIAGTHSLLRLCHPAHADYLIDLSIKWNRATRPAGVYIRTLTDVLVRAARPELWSCKAVTKFTKFMHNQDFGSFMGMAGQLVGSLPEVGTGEPVAPVPRRRTRSSEESSLEVQLNKWLNYSPSFPPSEDVASIIEFLEQCRRSGPLAATVACWATHSLTLLPDGEIHPTVMTYSYLVERSFGLEQISLGKLPDIKVTLRAYASCLRAKGLLLLEASLWTYLPVPCGSRQAVALYREELMDLVDDAERRCFGRELQGSSPYQALRPRWKWEESLGCWAEHDLPLAKKTQFSHELRPRPDLRVHRRPPLAVRNDDETEPAALSNRTQLHGSASKRTFHPYPRGPSRTLLSPSHSEDTIPSSEDALDLFAYTDNL